METIIEHAKVPDPIPEYHPKWINITLLVGVVAGVSCLAGMLWA